MQTENEMPEVAQQEPTQAPKKKKDAKREILDWILTLGAAVIIALLIRNFLFEPVRVDGESMMDTLVDHEIMFVTKPEYLLGDPQRGDVVICRYPDLDKPIEKKSADGTVTVTYENRKDYFVKRVIGIPGDVVAIEGNTVYINGSAIEEPYLTPSRNSRGRLMEPVTLGEDEYFVMGDNRNNSHDSRNYDPDGSPRALHRDQIIGHVRCVIFPFSNIRGIE